MDEFLTNNLGSLAWWLGVVLVGVVLNIVSSYFRNGIDRSLSRVSRWWALRSEKRRAEIETVVEILSNDEFQFSFYATGPINERLRMVINTVALCGIMTGYFVLHVNFQNRGELNTDFYLRLSSYPLLLFMSATLGHSIYLLRKMSLIINRVLARRAQMGKVYDAKRPLPTGDGQQL